MLLGHYTGTSVSCQYITLLPGHLYRDITLLPILYFVTDTGYHSHIWHIVLWYTNCGTLVLRIRDLILSRPTAGSLDHRRSLQGMVYCLEGRNGAFNGKMSNVSKKLFVWENPQGAGRLFVWRVYVSRQGSCESGCPAKILCLQDFPISHTPPPPTSPTPPPSYLSRSTPSGIIESHTHVDISSSFNILFPKGYISSDFDDWKSSRYPFQSLCYSHYYCELMND